MNIPLFSKLQKFQHSKIIAYTAILVFLLPFYVVVYKLYIPHINSFGCFDECMNYLGGYFLLQGRALYSQIFFNHQPLMAYVSWIVLKIFHPGNMFEVLLAYKQFLLFIGLIGDFFLIKRFKFAGVGFVIIFELSKYYLFGDKFLAESIIVYPLVYLIGLVIYKYENQKIHPIEFVLSGILGWFVVFSREPFILVCLAILFLLLGVPRNIYQKIGYAVFLGLSSMTYLLLPLSQYMYQVFIINSQGVGSADAKSIHLFGLGIFQVFFYPFYIFFQGSWNEYRLLLVGISLVFCLLSIYFIFKKQFKLIALLWIILGLSNLRPITPGQVFYSSFHFIPYFGMLILATFLLITRVYKVHRNLFYIGSGVIFSAFVAYVFLSKNFIFYHVNEQAEFVINFGESYEVGSVIHSLSQPSNTFFIDNADNIDIAYLSSHRRSPYAYADYGFVAPGYRIFQQAYKTMWKNNPPDFYFGTTMPKNEHTLYVILEKEGKQSKIYVKKSVLKTIPSSAWEDVKNFGYTKPNVF